MAEHASGGQGASLDDERKFLRQCSDHPDEVDIQAIFERLDADSGSVGEDDDVRGSAIMVVQRLVEVDNPELVGETTERLLALLDEGDSYTRGHTLETLVDVAKTAPETLETAIPRLTALVDTDTARPAVARSPSSRNWAGRT